MSLIVIAFCLFFMKFQMATDASSVKLDILSVKIVSVKIAKPKFVKLVKFVERKRGDILVRKGTKRWSSG